MIEYTFEKGSTLYVAPIKLLYCFQQDISSCIHIDSISKCLVGVGVSKRYFKRAVDRNRIKRLIREAYRLQKHILLDGVSPKCGSLYCFIQYTQNVMPTFDIIYSKMEIILQKLLKIVHEKGLDSI